MTFVIKEQVESIGFNNEDYLFDIEGYNYIFERNSIFTIGDLIKQNYEKLSYILKNFIKIDSILLESLNYQAAIAEDFGDIMNFKFKKNDEKNKLKSPLHLAVKAKNTRIINLLLFYMSKLELKNDYVMRNLFKQLIKYQGF